MAEDHWTTEIEVNGQTFLMECIRRPFREGVEVRIQTPHGLVSFADFGLGNSALAQKAQSVLRAMIKDKND